MTRDVNSMDSTTPSSDDDWLDLATDIPWSAPKVLSEWDVPPRGHFDETFVHHLEHGLNVVDGVREDNRYVTTSTPWSATAGDGVDYDPNVERQRASTLPFRAAMAHAGWRDAIRREAEGLYQNDTFELVKYDPKVMKLVKARWVFAVKDTGKLKARLVAKGFSQRSGIDFDVDGTAVGNPFLQLQRDFYSSCAFAFDL